MQLRPERQIREELTEFPPAPPNAILQVTIYAEKDGGLSSQCVVDQRIIEEPGEFGRDTLIEIVRRTTDLALRGT